MAASRLQIMPYENARVEFNNYLKQENIRRFNYEGKEFYRPEDIKKWMRQAPTGLSRSNAARLLYEVYEHHELIQPTEETQINGHLLVFAILAHPNLECGHMIHIFRKHIGDAHLGILDLSRIYHDVTADLSRDGTSLPKRYRNEGFAAVTSAFDRLRWAFSPAPLDLNMDQSFPQGSCILPFCYSKHINAKGGTASVQMYGMQEDLVVSKGLREALHSSRKKDPKFGWCYELAVKSYIPGWADIHKMESQAFKGMRDQEGVVKYLGEYHLVNSLPGEYIPTSHLMLEYGELDLDEYLAETYPPILSEEVLTFWEGLFKVAGTIKRLHHLRHMGGDGREQHFKGWHGDIKPDNILLVRGEYMLADFGFTKFEKDIVGHNTTHLLGGTRTYDTWSFGCVLSAVATWVVLGSQAYENYGKRRELAINKLRQRAQKTGTRTTLPSCDDTFHDGQSVLRAVTDWHDYLRNSCRHADTITPLVLDLVDKKMLLSRPQERSTLEQLCNDLHEIMVLARDRYQRAIESGELKKVTSETLEALLELDEGAPAVAMPASQAARLPEIFSSSIAPSDPTRLPESNNSHQLAPPTSRVRKSERFDKIVVAKTANRKEVIMGGLGKPPVPTFNAHVVHESPEQHPSDFTTESSPSEVQRRAGRTPELLILTDPLVSTPTTVSPIALPDREGHQQPQAVRRRPNRPEAPYHSLDATEDADQHRQNPPLYIPFRPGNDNQDGRHSGNNGSTFRNGQRETFSHSPPSLAQNSLVVPRATELPNTWSAPGTAAELPASDTNHYSQPYSLGHSLPLNIHASPADHHHGRVPIQDHAHHQNTEPEEVNENVVLIPSVSVQHPDPGSTAIYKEYNHLREEWGEKRGSWSKFLRTRKVPEDAQLKRFISNRDIMFVVDNAASMKPHWEHMRTTLLALAMKIGTLDKDGLDLVFTLGQSCDKSNVKEWEIPAEFGKSMDKARREITSNDNTNMAETFLKIFDRYTDVRKKQTLVVLTDGLWNGGSRTGDDVETAIISFITDVRKRLKGKQEPRWFSIQFISFGNDVKAIARLTALDDELHAAEDVVDHKPWDGPDVDKLILGSIMKSLDDPPAQSPAHTTSLRSQSPAPSQSDKHSLGRKRSIRERLSNILSTEN